MSQNRRKLELMFPTRVMVLVMIMMMTVITARMMIMMMAFRMKNYGPLTPMKLFAN